MITPAFLDTRQMIPATAAHFSLALCRQTPRGAWYLVLAVIPPASPQCSAPAMGRLDFHRHERIEEEAERWDGLS